MKALIVVDMQNDFITGSLAVPRAEEIIAPILNKVMTAYHNNDLIFYSRCWHPPEHCSFDINGGPWPVHCLRDTYGSELVEPLKYLYVIGFQLLKGVRPDEEAYSAFANPMLQNTLNAYKIGRIEMCGLARDYCVKATAEEGIAIGYSVKILEDLCRSVHATRATEIVEAERLE